VGSVSGQRIYLETSLVSYLAARPSRDLITAAHQQVTHEWWETRRSEFEILVSQLVLDEAAGGDPSVADRRLAYLKDLPVLAIDQRVEELARTLIERIGLPKRAGADAVPIATATRYELDFLLTWNFLTSRTHSLGRRSSGSATRRDFGPPCCVRPAS